MLKSVQVSVAIRLCTLSVSAVQIRSIKIEQRFVESHFDVRVLLCAGEMQKMYNLVETLVK